LAVSKQSDNIENKNNEDHNMELEEHSEQELPNSEPEDNVLPELNTTHHIIYLHIQQAKQSTDLCVNIYICSARMNKLEI